MSRYIVRIRYSSPDELKDGNRYILFERYHRKLKSWVIMNQFKLEYSNLINDYIMPVEVISFIRKLTDDNYDIYYDYLNQNIE